MINDDLKYFQKKVEEGLGLISPTATNQLNADVDKHIAIFEQLAQCEWISKRFGGSRFLGLTDEQLLENERLWAEENKSRK